MSRPYRRSGPELAEAIPVEKALVDQAVNPKNEKPYAGPTGIVAGVISVKGDEPPKLDDVLAKIPTGKCARGRDTYGALFREGMMRALGDVLVTVTGYEGYVPAKQPAVAVVADECSWGSRTIGVTFGQRIEVTTRDGQTYLPKLVGSKQRAILAVIPGAAPVNVYPEKPAAHYQLVDQGKPFMVADVFVLKYATFDVTGLDGRYRIEGVPVGKAKVGALLPATFQSVEKDVVVAEGKTTEVDLEIAFDAKRDVKKVEPRPAPTIH